FRVPDAYLAVYTNARRGLEIADRTRLWVPDRPSGWVPKAGDRVRVVVRGAWEDRHVTGVRGGVVGTGEWTTILRVCPALDAFAPRAALGDVVATDENGATAEVVALDDTGVSVFTASGESKRVRHGAYFLLRPPAAVSLPVVPL